MLGFIKNLFGKGPEAKPTTTPEAPATPAAKPQPVAAPAPPPAAGPGGETITVTLKGIVDALPPELKGLVTNPPKDGATIKVSLQKVLEGLPKGSVKITYADLKAQAGGGFGGDASLDQTPVNIPLREVLSKVKPGQFTLRKDQKTIDVPDDIKPVFGADGETSPTDTKPAAPAPAPTPQAAAPAPAPAPAAPVAPAKPTPPPAPSPEASAPIKSSMGLPDPASLRPAAAAPKPAPAPVPTPKPTPAPAPPAPAPAPASVAPKPAAPAPAAAPSGTLTGSVESLATSWPEDIKGELAKHNLPGLNLTLPLDLVEPMMRKGKILFTWPQLRGWITPALPASLGANRDTESLELPLKVIIPLFMAARKPGAQQKSVAVDQNIPDVFSGKLPTPAAAPAPAPKATAPAAAAPAPAPAPAAPAPAITPAVPVTSSGPADLVAKAAALPNVAGVVVASPEGLKVASQLPAEFNADAFAGFVVAMFSRMNQFTGDLKLGEPKALTVQTSSRSLAIVKSGRTFLAVIGKPDAVLPVEDLKKLAATLS